MTDWFTSLVRRSSGSADVLRPRVPALFEPLVPKGSLSFPGTFPPHEHEPGLAQEVVVNEHDGSSRRPGSEPSSPVDSSNYLSRVIMRQVQQDLTTQSAREEAPRPGSRKLDEESLRPSVVSAPLGTPTAPPSVERSAASLANSDTQAEAVESRPLARQAIGRQDMAPTAGAPGPRSPSQLNQMRSTETPMRPVRVRRAGSSDREDLAQNTSSGATPALPEGTSELPSIAQRTQANPIGKGGLLDNHERPSSLIPAVLPARTALRDGFSQSVLTDLHSEPPEPVVNVTIGRVVVQAVLPPTAKAREGTTPSVTSLDEYLRQRSRRAGQ